MKAAIYNPYLETLGGGERYTMSFASVLDELGYQVEIEWDDESILTKIQDRFGLTLPKVRVVSDIKKGEDYEICLWVSDGSIPMLRARKNYLHFQMPFKDVDGRSLINRMKMFRIEKIICNSYFTKSFIDKEYAGEKIVIYPPVATDAFKAKKKEKLIVYLGRFSQLTQTKNQDILVERFKSFYDSGYRDWKMILAGGIEVGVDDYVDNLRDEADGYPIRFIESPSFSELIELLGRASIFWSAAGYDVDENEQPDRVEHFGISTVEAMSSGAVPIVYNAGGQKEIIENEKNGFLWSDKNQLTSITKRLTKDNELLKRISKEAVKDSKIYEYDRFRAQVEDIIS